MGIEMIQNEDTYIKLLEGLELNNDEEIIYFIKEKGANQMTCTKVLMKVKKIRLREADTIVQNSVHWSDFKDGNESIEDKFFSKDDNLEC